MSLFHNSPYNPGRQVGGEHFLQIGDGFPKERKAKLKCGLVGTLDNVKRKPNHTTTLVVNASSFTNFEKHLISCHNEEYKQYNLVLSKDPTQSSLLSFNVHSIKKKKQRQIKLDTELAFSIAVDNIPLNILRKPRFCQWVEV